MYKALHIIGNRPHFIKLAPVHNAIQKTGRIDQVIAHTGQHYDEMLSEHFIKELNIPAPNYNLGVGSKRPLVQMAEILQGLDAIIQEEIPDIILVYGDTNSTAAGAIAAAKSNIPLGHVESGLREYSKEIPEEINKLLTDSITDLYFCPTKTGENNLKAAGVTHGLHMVGDVGLDLIQLNKSKIDSAEEVLDKLEIKAREYIFMTCHRASNTNNVDNLKVILEAANKFDKSIVFPIHPRTKCVVQENNLRNLMIDEKWKVIRPLGFFETQALIRNAAFCYSDSGGIIKESYFHKTPCIITDKQTEWIETVEEGWCHVCGPNAIDILETVNNLVRPQTHYNSLGDGSASTQIAEIIVSYLSKINK